MFAAKVVWPSAPLTDSLVRHALLRVLPDIQISDANLSSDSRSVQWSSYDEIDHVLVNLQRDTVLSSSYTFRKCLIRKHFLSRSIFTYLTKNPDSLLRNAWPRTFEIEISFVDELDEIFADELWELADELQNSKTWWILKPLSQIYNAVVPLFTPTTVAWPIVAMGSGCFTTGLHWRTYSRSLRQMTQKTKRTVKRKAPTIRVSSHHNYAIL
ncbi:hypothetical protein E1B28_001228 [Marasmius oreades]|uniref:Uncharacterized protein n=1 Tax=Marasmius oreades TaxID=181124 RepID=A0A9P8AF67_9AGAR|nr:uncharacterized protein E1B28_001228 [Marasmius oreades]KAG7099372.1 hypothetical protein E1B28_001228 [Marasmius oreades]